MALSVACYVFYSSVILNSTETAVVALFKYLVFYSSVILNSTETKHEQVRAKAWFYSSVILNSTETTALQQHYLFVVLQ